MTTILSVDDDQHIQHLIKVYLQDEGFRIIQAENGLAALSILQKEQCDLAIVDIMMPYLDGYQLTQKIRQNYDLPIILLTAKGQIEDKEKGYSAGTDDYLVKPFEPKELLFRIQALLRRYEKRHEPIITFGSTTINRKSYEVQVGEHVLLLPLKEFELLYFLASYPNIVFSRSHLIEELWGVDYDGDERTVDVHIKRLRERFRNLSKDFTIRTVRGVGYQLEVNQP